MIPKTTISVIVPTKNRVDDLEIAVRTLLRQTVLPDELVVVDQSDGDASRLRTNAAFREHGSATRLPILHYTHDSTIPGGAVARNRAMDQAIGEILLFLDDDVELEEDFTEQLLATYASHSDITGVSGIITNYTPPALIVRVWKRIFEHGPFSDDRQPLYWYAEKMRETGVHQVSRMTGALMSFRRSAIGEVPFDERLRGVSDGEDVDFCLHLGRDARFLVNPCARLVHNRSRTGRLQDHWLRRYLRSQTYLYRRNWQSGIMNRIPFGWLLVGSSMVASVASFRLLSAKPWRAMITGYREGIEAGGGVTRCQSAAAGLDFDSH